MLPHFESVTLSRPGCITKTYSDYRKFSYESLPYPSESFTITDQSWVSVRAEDQREGLLESIIGLYRDQYWYSVTFR